VEEERINDVDSFRLVAKLQKFANWWASEWFPPLTVSDRGSELPPALEWELQCFHSYGETCDGFVTDQSTNPIVRFETNDQTFAPTYLNDFVVGTVFLWCAGMSNEEQRVTARTDEICPYENMIWDGSYVDGRVRAWLSGEELVIETPGYGTTMTQRPRSI
jgi:hypothetical protein